MTLNPRNKTSLVWEHFSIDEEQPNLAVCKLCDTKILRGPMGKPRSYSTSSLVYHLKKFHFEAFKKYEESKHQVKNQILNQENNTNQITIKSIFEKSKPWDINNPQALKIHFTIGKMLAIDIQPLSFVEDQGFKMLMAVLEPRYKVPSRKYFSEVILPSLFENIKLKIKNKIKNAIFISFSTDMWTESCTTQSYMCLTAHWIDLNFIPNSAILFCEAFDEIHSSINISGTFLTMISDWSIDLSKCHAIVHDNAANSKKAFRNIGFDQVFCAAHSIQLVIKDSLDSNAELQSILATIRKIVGHFKSSSSASIRLREIQEVSNFPILQPIQDVKTRWNSTFYMIRRFIEIKNAISIFCTEKQNFISLNAVEFKIVEELILILTPFEKITRDLSNENSTISMVIPALKALNIFLSSTSSNLLIQSIKNSFMKSMNIRFMKIEENPIYSIATFLDPRYKMRLFNSVTIQNLIKSQITDNEYFLIHDEKKMKVKEINNNMKDDIWSYLDEDIETISETTLNSSDSNSEYKIYSLEATIPRTGNIFDWWKNNSSRFPILSAKAKKFLSIPPTSVPSERVFSTAGDVIDDHRAKLLPDNAEKLIFLKTNSKYFD